MLFGTGALVLIWHGLRVRQANQLPARPPTPSRRVAELDFSVPEPARRVPVLADFCTICGRALSNPASRLARVGSECVKVHGPRPLSVLNPAYGEWVVSKRVAEAEAAAKQRSLDRQHDQALLLHTRDVRRWELSLETPEMVRRRLVRIEGQRLAGAGLTLTAGIAAAQLLGS
ncbi:DUF6011 domain-containing protein [Phycicoccus sp. Soil802]|uniref:DUF6011 domain-containing protein n=1 Tax=Phycicoccus sp. Soil802 TaxID=1736414 RepID=UPI0035291B6B